jgi:drug/metabolite transporter (DMT)-like permease
MKRSTLVILLLMNVIWAGTYPATKALMAHAPYYLVTSLRYIIAALPLLLIAQVKYGLKMSAGDFGRAVVIGVASFTLSPIALYQGVTFSRAADAAVLVSIEPLLIAVGAYIFLREHIARRTALALLAAFGGVLLLSEFWRAHSVVRPLGTALILLAIFFETTYSLVGKSLLKRVPPLKITAVAITSASVINVVALSALGYWPAAGRLTHVDWLVLVGFLALLCSAFGYTLWYVALAQDLAANVAITVFVQPVVGIPLAWAWVGETPTAPQLLGALVILAAVAAALRPARRAATEPSA